MSHVKKTTKPTKRKVREYNSHSDEELDPRDMDILRNDDNYLSDMSEHYDLQELTTKTKQIAQTQTVQQLADQRNMKLSNVIKKLLMNKEGIDSKVFKQY
jgi:regulatory protein YycH of two-component signal transduction system YycFG